MSRAKSRSFSLVMWRTRSTISCIGSTVPPGTSGEIPSGFSALGCGRPADFDPVKFPYLRELMEGLPLPRREAAAHALDLRGGSVALGRGFGPLALALEDASLQQVQTPGPGPAA